MSKKNKNPRSEKAKFETLDFVPFYETDYSQYRVNVVSINGDRPLLSISKYLWAADKNDWRPAMKNLFLPKESFLALLDQASELRAMADSEIAGVLMVEIYLIFVVKIQIVHIE